MECYVSDHDEIRTAYIPLRGRLPKPVEYSVVDGLCIFEGDICLGCIDEVVRRSYLLRDIEEGVMNPEPAKHWPKSVVPYTLRDDLPVVTRDRVVAATKTWERKTDLKFVPRTNQFDYVEVIPSSGCWSHVGMIGGKQDLGLSIGCSQGNAEHEWGHAVGLWHEQSREDRDRWIEILWDNIHANRRSNFNQHVTDGDDVGPYDYGSIMHYPLTAFAIDRNKPTMRALKDVPEGVQIGQREEPSDWDVMAVMGFYDLPDNVVIDNRVGYMKKEWIEPESIRIWKKTFPSRWVLNWSAIPVTPIPTGGALIKMAGVTIGKKGDSGGIEYIVMVYNHSQQRVRARVQFQATRRREI